MEPEQKLQVRESGAAAVWRPCTPSLAGGTTPQPLTVHTECETARYGSLSAPCNYCPTAMAAEVAAAAAVVAAGPAQCPSGPVCFCSLQTVLEIHFECAVGRLLAGALAVARRRDVALAQCLAPSPLVAPICGTDGTRRDRRDQERTPPGSPRPPAASARSQIIIIHQIRAALAPRLGLGCQPRCARRACTIQVT